MQKGCRFITFCALLTALIRPAFCADTKPDLRDFAVRIWGISEGLPDTSVTAIVQTRDGYLWVGTDSGLFRFDGFGFDRTALSRSKTNTVITSLCEDNTGALWIGTGSSGLYSLRNGQVQHFGTNEGLLDQNVTSLALDNGNCLWIGTAGGVNRFEKGHFSSLTRTDGLQEDSVLNIYAARSGHVWITTSGGTCQFLNGKLEKVHFPSGEEQSKFLRVYEDRRGNLWGFCSTYLINLTGEKRINYFPGEKSDVTRIWNLCEGRGGRLWIGAAGRGLFCFDGSKFQPVTLNEGRWPNDVRTIYEDREGTLWLGIPGVGLVQLRAQTFTLATENLGLPAGAATAIVSDAAGHIHVGMESGGVYQANAEHFEPVNPQDHFLAQDLITSLCANEDGTIWAGTEGNGLYRINQGKVSAYTTADGLEDDSILSICSGTDGSVWMGTRFGAIQQLTPHGMKIFTQADGLPGTAITALLAAHDGTLWIGTSNGELLHAENGFKTITVQQLSRKLVGKPILALRAVTNALWIGSEGGGLGYVSKETQRAWDSQDGMPDNTVWDMVEDDDANLWLATPTGLCRINNDSILRALSHMEPLKVKLVYETDQFTARTLPFCGPHAVRSTSGRLWFALNSGLVGLDIHGRDSERLPPQVQIESMMVDHKPMPFGLNASASETGVTNLEPVSLPSALQTLEFRFTGLSFDAPEKLRFRHKMDGIDANWVQNGTERQVTYGRLPSGNYEFHVTACNAEGIWNEQGASIAIVIPPPFWRTPLPLGTAGLMAIAFVIGTVRVVSHRRLRTRLERLQQQQAMQRERIRIAQNMHDEIGSKLTKISYLSERARAEFRGDAKAEGKIDSIASTSRDLLKALDEIVWAVNPKNDTLEHLAAYFCQYAREYFQDTNVDCDLRIQSHLPEIEMSAETRHNLFLAFEETLNNVLKHSQALHLKMDISTDATSLRIIIRDNGVGFDPAKTAGQKATGGNGLRNIRQRLASMGGNFILESTPGQGTCISLSVPLDFGKIRNS